MACIESIAHVSCFQSRLCILYNLWHNFKDKRLELWELLKTIILHVCVHDEWVNNLKPEKC